MNRSSASKISLERNRATSRRRFCPFYCLGLGLRPSPTAVAQLGTLCVLAACSVTVQEPPKGSSPNLARTAWQLVKFQASDGTTLTPDDKSKYTIEFDADGVVVARIDCNRGRGRWYWSAGRGAYDVPTGVDVRPDRQGLGRCSLVHRQAWASLFVAGPTAVSTSSSRSQRNPHRARYLACASHWERASHWPPSRVLVDPSPL